MLRNNGLNSSIAPMAATALLASATGAAPPVRRFDAAARLRSLEVGPARLGVCFPPTGTGEVSGNRMEEHFAMRPTFKLALVAACLRESDQGRLNLAQILTYSEADLLSWAPGDGQESRQRRHEHCRAGAAGPRTKRRSRRQIFWSSGWAGRPPSPRSSAKWATR